MDKLENIEQTYRIHGPKLIIRCYRIECRREEIRRCRTGCQNRLRLMALRQRAGLLGERRRYWWCIVVGPRESAVGQGIPDAAKARCVPHGCHRGRRLITHVIEGSRLNTQRHLARKSKRPSQFFGNILFNSKKLLFPFYYIYRITSPKLCTYIMYSKRIIRKIMLCNTNLIDTLANHIQIIYFLTLVLIWNFRGKRSRTFAINILFFITFRNI